MMKMMVTKRYSFCLALTCLLTLAVAPAYCGNSYVLLLEQTPIEGGVVTPGAGVHNFTPGQTVTVTAAPRPGYQFVRWMGDVSATDAGTTTVTLDSPKVLVAVFERVEYSLPIPAREPREESGGGGASGGFRDNGGARLVAQSQNVGGGGGASPATTPLYHRPSSGYPASIVDNPIDSGDGLPVTDNDGKVPEPTTIMILGLGAVMGLSRRKK
jgi:hypothetical protein